jgi:exodeoxyribonuclease III
VTGQKPAPDGDDPLPAARKYGVMIISRVQAQPDDLAAAVSYLRARAASVTLSAPVGPIQVIGAYAPSRDAGPEKAERKRTWLAAFRAALAVRDPANPAVLLGDLNVLEPGHQPRYPFFAPFANLRPLAPQLVTASMHERVAAMNQAIKCI